METNTPHILAVNVGSSNVKFALFSIVAKPEKVITGTVAIDGALEEIMKQIGSYISSEAVTAVVHRVVSGGPKYLQTAPIDDAMRAELSRRSTFDPNHVPAELGLIEQFAAHLPHAVPIACFDTTFFADVPRVAQLLPIPRRYYEQGLRRYGFHGLSYEYLLKEVARRQGTAVARGRIVMAHLGSGASLVAIKDGKPIDTTMAFTPASGIPMSTRAGDLDPGIVHYLAQSEGMETAEFNDMVNHRSGLLGLSEVSGEMYYLLEHEASDPRCADAVALFCYEIKKRIGAFAAAMGGIDLLVWSGGMGEEAPRIRRRVCEGLEFLGITLDTARNEAGEDIISPEGNRVSVLVIRSDEESTMIDEACRILAHHG
ncbi:MAG TPA: acetate/propionate family kinase [Candidatus Paceibacterota bacterium]|nr:acetate/propionate family kinase [Candidatus Paceibacterota bacterium]